MGVQDELENDTNRSGRTDVQYDFYGPISGQISSKICVFKMVQSGDFIGNLQMYIQNKSLIEEIAYLLR